MSPRQQAEQGKDLIKGAIVVLLQQKNAGKLTRSQIEDALNIGSSYTGEKGGASYEGALASMFLTQLVAERLIQREKSGSAWHYWID